MQLPTEVKYKDTQKRIALLEELGPPDIDEIRTFSMTPVAGKRRLLWERAFTLYNSIQGINPISMFCVPCYIKVYRFLLTGEVEN